MREVRQFLGTTIKFSEAYPEIEKLKITIEEDLFGYHVHDRKYSTTHFTEKNISSRVSCPNPRCERGGLDIDYYLRCLVMQGKTESRTKEGCNGDEGSPQGRRRGRPCDVFFEIKVEITYRRN